MSKNNAYIHRDVDATAIAQLKANANWYLLLGIGLVVFGTLALIFSFITTLVSVLYLGIFLVIVGLFEGFKSFKINRWASFFLHLALSILYVVVGIFVILNPTANALTLTLFLAAFFVVAGIFRIIFSFSHRIPHKGWLLLNGILSIILGVLIWKQWPYSGLWVIGTLVGIDTIFTGWTWIMLSFEAKRLKA